MATYVTPGDSIAVTARANGAQVIRLGLTTFYQRTQRKLGINNSAELDPTTPFAPNPDAPIDR